MKELVDRPDICKYNLKEDSLSDTPGGSVIHSNCAGRKRPYGLTMQFLLRDEDVRAVKRKADDITNSQTYLKCSVTVRWSFTLAHQEYNCITCERPVTVTDFYFQQIREGKSLFFFANHLDLNDFFENEKQYWKRMPFTQLPTQLVCYGKVWRAFGIWLVGLHDLWHPGPRTPQFSRAASQRYDKRVFDVLCSPGHKTRWILDLVNF